MQGHRPGATWSRRSLLVGTSAIGGAALTGGCLLPRRRPPRSTPAPPRFPTAQEATAALTELVEQTGRNHIQRLWMSPGYLSVYLLMADGRTFNFTRVDTEPWQDKGEDHLTGEPVSLRVDELSLDKLPEFVAHAGPELDDLAFDVDDTGRLRISGDTGGSITDRTGLEVDGSGLVPTVDLTNAADVVGAIGEVTETFGSKAAAVGSFNDFVHVDLNLDKITYGMRAIRRRREDPYATVAAARRYVKDLLFDPADIDPTPAVELLPTIAGTAKLKGKAWDWEFRRPAPDSEPLLAFGVGEKGPDSLVWVDRSGKIIKITSGDCPPGTGWCRR